ncbi:hypothetical protein [Pleurochrysis sp. Polinton-like virus]|nr:hypothetical protein [Pleurochrysis sp. Polinton-like virus]
MTITPYTSTTNVPPVVVASREGLVRYTAGGRWEVVEEEDGGDGTMVQYVQSPTLPYFGFLIVSSIHPLLFSAKTLPFLTNLSVLFDTLTLGAFDSQQLTFVGGSWTNAAYYNNYDLRLGRGPFIYQRINKYGIHIGSMTGLKTQTWRDPIAVGYDCAPQQTGDYSLALGCRACVGGSQSFDCVALGSECCALGQQERAVCVGFKACSLLQKQEDRSIAIGYESYAYGTSCVCIGSKTKCSFGKSIVLSASDEPFEAQSANAFYVNPKNVDHASLSDFDLSGAATLMYTNGRFEHFKDFVPSSVTVVNNGIARDEEGVYRIPLVDAIDPAIVSMHSTHNDEKRCPKGTLRGGQKEPKTLLK